MAEVHHGPSNRTTETARRLAAALPGVVPRVSEHLRDRTPFPVPGQESALSERHLAWFRTVPEAERDPDGAAIDTAIEHFAGVAAGDRHVVLVTHSFVIGWFVRRALRLPWDGWTNLQPLPAALTVMTVQDAARFALVAYNDGGHLTGGLRTDDSLHWTCEARPTRRDRTVAHPLGQARGCSWAAPADSIPAADV